MRTKRGPRLLLLLSLPALIPSAGCSPDAYRQSADRDVNRILHERKFDTAGYATQTVVGPPGAPEEPEKVPSTPPPRGYERIPMTVLPPREPPAVELPVSEVPSGPLGPFLDELPKAPDNGPAPTTRAVPGTRIPIPGPVPSPDPSAGPARAPVADGIDLPSTRPATTPATGPAVDPGPPNGVVDVPEPASPGPPVARAPASDSDVRYQTPETESIGRVQDRLQYGPPAPRPHPVTLDLYGALRFAVQHSREYRDEMDEVYLAALDVTLERHVFEPQFFLRQGVNYVGGQSDVNYRSALTATTNGGVRQRLPYGGEIVAAALVSFVQAIEGNVDEGESAQIALTGSLPLLRGAGLVNLEPLIASEREVVYRIRAFEDFRRRFAVDIASQYFRLLTQIQNVANRRENVGNLSLLRQRALDLYVRGPKDLPGRLNYLEVQRAEQALLNGQDLLLQAQITFLNALDDFKVTLGMEVKQELDLVPVTLVVTVPETVREDLLAVAERFRLDLQTARDRIDDRRRGIEVAENGLLPDLNLTAEGRGGNRVGDPVRRFSDDSLTYAAGVNLEFPIDRLAERNVYRRAVIDWHRASRAFEDLRDLVFADVRSAARSIRQAESSLEIQRRAIGVAERRVQYANILLQQGGRINTRDVVEAQQSLLDAQDRYERARADLQVQVLQYLRQTGTLRVDPEAGFIGRALNRDAAMKEMADQRAEARRQVDGANAGPPARP